MIVVNNLFIDRGIFVPSSLQLVGDFLMKIRIAKGVGICLTAALLLPAMTLAQESAVVVERDSNMTVRAG